MSKLLLVIIALSISGCARQRLGLELYDPEVYTRAENDAIQAEVQCKANARTQLQMARCIGNRRGP